MRLTLRRRSGSGLSSLRRLFFSGLERGEMFTVSMYSSPPALLLFRCAALILYLIFDCRSCGGCLLPGIRCLFSAVPDGFLQTLKTPPINRVYLILYPASQRNIRAQAPKPDGEAIDGEIAETLFFAMKFKARAPEIRQRKRRQLGNDCRRAGGSGGSFIMSGSTNIFAPSIAGIESKS